MPGWRIALWAAVVLVAVLFLYLVRGILLPFLVAFTIAALLEPAVRRLRLRGLSRGLSVAVVVAGFYGAMVLAGALVVPSLVRETQSLTDQATKLASDIAQSNDEDSFFLRWNPAVKAHTTQPSEIDRMLSKYGPYLQRVGLPTSRREIMEQYVDKNRPQIAKAIQSFSNSAFGFLTNIFGHLMFVIIVPILVPLFLGEFESIRRRGPRYIPPSIRESTIRMLGEIGQVFTRYLRGVASVVLLYSMAMTLFLWLAGVRGWPILGPLFGLLYLIPYVGNVISAITVFTVVGASGPTGWLFHPAMNSWAYGAIVTAIYLTIGFIFDHFIYPQMVGNSVGLSPVVSMFVIFCGGALFGLPGMLIAFPLAGSVKVILDRILRVTSTSTEGLNVPVVPLRHRSTG
ncbi:AI-2E family transporter [bacterium]|nr:MAG: AI-2E family transporter [bacterium]